MKIIEKPWGREEVIEINENYMMKKLTMWKGHRCSLQLHNIKKETRYQNINKTNTHNIISGPNKDNLTGRIYSSGETITIAPGTVHRMEGAEDSIYLEASTPEMDDVVRLVDDYHRD